MSVQTQIDRLETAKNAIVSAITGKGVSVPSGTKLDGLAALIASIVTGGGSGGGGSGGGLPSGVSALTFGTFTPTSDCKSDWPIEHNLGQTPNFFLFYTNDMHSVADMAGYCFAQAVIPKRLFPKGAFYFIGFVTTSNMIQGISTQNSDISTVLASNLFVVDVASSRKLKGGVTYNWICGVIDMEN